LPFQVSRFAPRRAARGDRGLNAWTAICILIERAAVAPGRGTEMNDSSDKYEVNVEGHIHPWHKGTISVPEIRELGGFPSGSKVVALNLEDNSEQPLAEGDVHDVVPLAADKPLVKRTCFKRASGAYEVNVEGQIHPWDKDTISVPEIRELGGFDSGSKVVAVNLEDNSEQALAESDVHDVVALSPGKPLVKRMSFKRG
jgi:hypothetical protein